MFISTGFLPLPYKNLITPCFSVCTLFNGDNYFLLVMLHVYVSNIKAVLAITKNIAYSLLICVYSVHNVLILVNLDLSVLYISNVPCICVCVCRCIYRILKCMFKIYIYIELLKF